MSKLSDFVQSKNINHNKLISVSRKLEKKQPADRAVHLAKKRVKLNKASDAQKEIAQKASRGGRGVTGPLLQRALRGDKIPKRGQQRIVRALQKVTGQELSAADLFDKPAPKQAAEEA